MAIEAGFRHIDCAAMYQNEEEIGPAIAKGMASQALRREDLFVTTKVCHPVEARIYRSFV